MIYFPDSASVITPCEMERVKLGYHIYHNIILTQKFVEYNIVNIVYLLRHTCLPGLASRI